jgi:hypothetical protein
MAARYIARDRQSEANPAGHRNTAKFRDRHSWVEVRGSAGPTANQESYAAIFIDCLNPETPSDHKNQTRAALGGFRSFTGTPSDGEVAPKPVIRAVVVERRRAPRTRNRVG